MRKYIIPFFGDLGMSALIKLFVIGMLLVCFFSCGCTDRETNNSFTTVPKSDPPSLPLTTASIIPDPHDIQTRSISRNLSEVYSLTHREDIQRMKSNGSDSIEKHFVPLETAQLHGKVKLARLFYTQAFGIATPNYEGAKISPDPKIVYDGDTGNPDYYVYCAVNQENQ
ncbi:MAG: hypothetical protein GYA23_04210, partial [Methanomicrobiales archaeon]|nr:hypothetical protein [Methanomicrobiales archaeon]